MMKSIFQNAAFSNLHSIITKAVAKAYSCPFSEIQLHIHASLAYDVCLSHILNKAHQIKDFSNVNGWIYRVSINKCIDIQRSQKHTIYLEEHQEANSEQNSEELRAEKELQLITLENALESLNEMSKKVITLRFINGCSYNDITKQTGLSKKSIGQTIHRGKKSIQKQLIMNQQLAA